MKKNIFLFMVLFDFLFLLPLIASDTENKINEISIVPEQNIGLNDNGGSPVYYVSDISKNLFNKIKGRTSRQYLTDVINYFYYENNHGCYKQSRLKNKNKADHLRYDDDNLIAEGNFNNECMNDILAPFDVSENLAEKRVKSMFKDSLPEIKRAFENIKFFGSLSKNKSKRTKEVKARINKQKKLYEYFNKAKQNNNYKCAVGVVLQNVVEKDKTRGKNIRGQLIITCAELNMEDVKESTVQHFVITTENNYIRKLNYDPHHKDTLLLFPIIVSPIEDEIKSFDFIMDERPFMFPGVIFNGNAKHERKVSRIYPELIKYFETLYKIEQIKLSPIEPSSLTQLDDRDIYIPIDSMLNTFPGSDSLDNDVLDDYDVPTTYQSNDSDSLCDDLSGDDLNVPTCPIVNRDDKAEEESNTDFEINEQLCSEILTFFRNKGLSQDVFITMYNKSQKCDCLKVNREHCQNCQVVNYFPISNLSSINIHMKQVKEKENNQ